VNDLFGQLGLGQMQALEDQRRYAEAMQAQGGLSVLIPAGLSEWRPAAQQAPPEPVCKHGTHKSLRCFYCKSERLEETRAKAAVANYFGTDRSKKLPTKEKKVNMVREYLNKHRDVIFTLGCALLVDHFILGGALRTRIQKVVEAALARVEKALGVETKDITPEQKAA
jgi:hypothetical protein